MWILQEVAGCTFAEARIYLRKERNETSEMLMEIYSLDTNAYAEAVESAGKKVAEANAKGNLFRGYGPLYPGRDETINW